MNVFNLIIFTARGSLRLYRIEHLRHVSLSANTITREALHLA